MTRSRQDVMVDRQAAAFDRKLAVRVRHPQRPLGDRPVEIHDYEPGEGHHPMHTEPACRVCGAFHD
jgi:hypothetical protein